MTWVNIPKPGAQIYANLNPAGKEQYDQATLTYDDVNTYYDGVNMNQWTDVSKPATNNWINVVKPT